MRLTIRTDGGSRGNPGPAGAGVVIHGPKHQLVFSGGFFLGHMTNNLAEYHALLLALERAVQVGGTEVEVFSDSELLVRQISGQYRVKNEHLQSLYQRACQLKSQFSKFNIAHVYREENAQADEMVNLAINAKRDVGGWVKKPAAAPAPADQSTPAPEDPPSLPAGVTILDIEPKIRFNKYRPHCETLAESPNGRYLLLCLAEKQRDVLESDSQGGLAVVLRGGGLMRADRYSQTLQPGSIVQWPPNQKIEFAAEQSNMVVWVHLLPPDQAASKSKTGSLFPE